jgi:hypothetical protein
VQLHGSRVLREQRLVHLKIGKQRLALFKVPLSGGGEPDVFAYQRNVLQCEICLRGFFADAAPYERTGSSAFRIARKVPIDRLPNGTYRLEVQVTDSAGTSTAWRAASFAVE